eukprot:211040-Ditylum_brightwellii.AAC.1
MLVVDSILSSCESELYSSRRKENGSVCLFAYGLGNGSLCFASIDAAVNPPVAHCAFANDLLGAKTLDFTFI